MFDFGRLRKPRYTGALEGLEECVPKFRSASIVLLTSRSHRGGGRRGRRIYGRKRAAHKRLTPLL